MTDNIAPNHPSVTNQQFSCFVAGIPRPAGSKTAIYAHDRIILLDGKTQLARQSHSAWRETVAVTVKAQAKHLGDLKGACKIKLEFVLRAPKQKKHPEPIIRPDIDKLVRSVLDACTGILYYDDAQIVSLVATKRYANDCESAGVYINLIR